VSVPVERVTWHGEALDFDFDENTNPQFERRSRVEAAVSCKNWLTLESTDLEAEETGWLSVRYTLHPPADLSLGSFACAVGLTKSGSKEPGRLVVEIYVAIGFPAIEGGPRQIKIESAPTSTVAEPIWQAVVVMENKGKMYYRPTGIFEILDVQGSVIQSFDFPSLTVQRERDQRILFPVKMALAAGNYTLCARIDIGTGEIQQVALDIVIDRPSRNTARSAADYPVPLYSER
jgi:hypothetical protein